MLRLRHVVVMLGVGAALSGCFPPPLSTPTVVTPTVTNAYDGTYSATVQLTSVAPMAHQSWCTTDTQAAVQITGGTLTYTQPHPGVPDTPVVTYTATVTTDSKFNGTSSESGTITGVISGAQLSATLDGLGCFYTLTAERI